MSSVFKKENSITIKIEEMKMKRNERITKKSTIETQLHYWSDKFDKADDGCE